MKLALFEESQPYLSFYTADGVVQLTRTTQGGCNSAANFQSQVEPCFGELRDHTLVWIDDFVLDEPNDDTLLNVLERFCEICAEENLVIWISKSTFFARSITRCGRNISSDGVKLGPATLSGLTSSDRPRNGM